MDRPGDDGEARWYDRDIDRVILTEQEIRDKTAALAAQVAADYRTVDQLLLVSILKGALVFSADFIRELGRHGPPVELAFLTASSYGQGATSSGVVRVRADLDQDPAGKHVLVVEDIVDSGLTLSWLLRYLAGRSAESVEVVTLLRKPGAVKAALPLRYVGFDIPTEFVVGYGLDYQERYRELPYVAVLKPEVYARDDHQG